KSKDDVSDDGCCRQDRHDRQRAFGVQGPHGTRYYRRQCNLNAPNKRRRTPEVVGKWRKSESRCIRVDNSDTKKKCEEHGNGEVKAVPIVQGADQEEQGKQRLTGNGDFENSLARVLAGQKDV